MALVQPPSFCADVTKSRAINPVAANASDAYWSNEANWYPANGTQDYYAQYIHTAQLNSVASDVADGDCLGRSPANIFLVPNNSIANGVANTDQLIPMGMDDAFGYDESGSRWQPRASSLQTRPDPAQLGHGT